jgi:hydroxymethylpyrimidine/phosphomethylpyrimidine kinase
MKVLLMSLILLVSGLARADIVCTAQTDLGQATVTIGDKEVTITGAALNGPEVFRDISSTYDGHAMILITAPGLSISYENAYGCIRHASITANLRDGDPLIQTFTTPLCAGGQSPDSICGVGKE